MQGRQEYLFLFSILLWCVHSGTSRISIFFQHFAMEVRLENISSSEALF